MVESRPRGSSRHLLAVLVVVVVLLGFLAVRLFEFPSDRLTIGAVVGGALLVIGALVLPAVLLSGWQSSEK
ncbi:hypothetical protein [Natrinema longum]|uniref:Uncharacterized protein n=1 Tax=Natrinema longum TaxID=370324 RepID=A0A8A2UDF7_9EURY|nr:hypothetical protein [Natrinema longum]MBZ6495522.1 hypothetical protein [Natrinema longum]QSW86512.1 hypothetical protein J0X27_06755 [Natrinema longum]